ncbi:MAG: glycerol kinase [Lachnospiraceae bacterium]|nr:glycerol kinase [Lachnospiraceae bacterium]
MSGYLISVDQSTQGTKALLFNDKGQLMQRTDLPHEQIINEEGWVSHDADEIYANTLGVIRNLVEAAGINKDEVKGLAISNQRETSVMWDRLTGQPLAKAIVWQCARATAITERPAIVKETEYIESRTGLKLSPYFSAAKISWLLENVPGAGEKAARHEVCHGTIDSYLVFRLTDGQAYRTDYSNASRTMLFDIFDLKWNEKICDLFGIDVANMPEVTDSNAVYGYTTCGGFFNTPIPICGVLGDSHAALFGQNCRRVGETKTTYGTGSSIMMNIGKTPVKSTHGVVTSLAWSCNGTAEYVLEGNLNYTGATITWLKTDMELIQSAAETEALAEAAHRDDDLYLVPAFTGLGAPYWDSHAKAAVVGMDRTTRKAEFVRAALESIAYQISDVIFAMTQDAHIRLGQLNVDGGPTRNKYLMQFQSDIIGTKVVVPDAEELSGIGAAYMGGMALGLWGDEVFDNIGHTTYVPKMPPARRDSKLAGWKKAVERVLQ